MVGRDAWADREFLTAEVLQKIPSHACGADGKHRVLRLRGLIRERINPTPLRDDRVRCIMTFRDVCDLSFHYPVVNASHFPKSVQQLLLQALGKFAAQNLRGQSFHSVTRMFG
jgi:hypothetical protein